MLHKYSHVAGPTHAKGNRKHVKRALILASCLVGTFMLLELIGGILSNSLALISDSMHMLSDFISLLFGVGAIVIASKANDNKKTYGYSRFEVVATFANGLFLLFVCFLITYEAISRIKNPPEVNASIMLPIAMSGMFINLLVLFIVHRASTKKEHTHIGSDPKKKNVSSLLLSGILLHVLSDLLGSLATIISGITIYYTNWFYIDPILSIFIVLLLLNSCWKIIRDSTNILMETTPKDIDIAVLASDIVKNVPGCINVHHIHLWMLNDTENIITLHAVLKNYDNTQEIVEDIKIFLKEKYNVYHSTIQVEVNLGHHLDRDFETPL